LAPLQKRRRILNRKRGTKTDIVAADAEDEAERRAAKQRVVTPSAAT
jgi:hypothetical protein